MADNKVNHLLRSLSSKADFKLNSQTIEIFGLCPNCQPGESDE
jgi:Fe2+ or Zn2+ uptake regulation protein